MTSKKKLTARLAVVSAYTIGTLYVGDALDVNQDYFTPLRDKVFQTETADGYAELQDLDLVSIVNEDNHRETYLRFKENENSSEQLTPVKDNGYAVPENLLERMKDYFTRKTDELKGVKAYDKLERWGDKLDLMIDYSKIKAKEFMDKIF